MKANLITLLVMVFIAGGVFATTLYPEIIMWLFVLVLTPALLVMLFIFIRGLVIEVIEHNEKGSSNIHRN